MLRYIRARGVDTQRNSRWGVNLQSVVGTPAAELDTPALLLDVEALDRNIDTVAALVRAGGVDWRPHVKGIKVPAIAHRLIAAGAVGVTCAKVSEAEVMAAAGIGDILIANQVVGEPKLRRLCELARRARLTVAVDSLENLRQIAATAQGHGVVVGALIEMNVGMNRCGVEPGAPALNLARAASNTEGIALRGLMAWEGHTQLIPGDAEKSSAVSKAVGALVQTAESCRAAGIPIAVVSCGGSGTFRLSSVQQGVTEIQAGGAVLGDVFYETTGAGTEIALSILSTVISRPSPDRIVTDAGKKAMSGDVAMPRPRRVTGVKRLRLAAEHGTIELTSPSPTPIVGEKLIFDVGYSDTTVFMHDHLYGVRRGTIESVWPILARGKIQ